MDKMILGIIVAVVAFILYPRIKAATNYDTNPLSEQTAQLAEQDAGLSEIADEPTREQLTQVVTKDQAGTTNKLQLAS